MRRPTLFHIAVVVPTLLGLAAAVVALLGSVSWAVALAGSGVATLPILLVQLDHRARAYAERTRRSLGNTRQLATRTSWPATDRAWTRSPAISRSPDGVG